GKVIRTLLSVLRTLKDKEKEDWKESLAKVVRAYNCTKNEATGYAPYYLIFGRSPRPPVELLFNLGQDESHETYDDYPPWIQTYWENQVYKVKERKADGSPVYEISPGNGKGRGKVVHRNLLLPCDFLPSDQPPQQQPEQSDTSDDEYGGTYHWHLRASRQRPQKQALLNPLAEPFQPQWHRPQRHEEDVPLQSQRPDLGCDRLEYGESSANSLPSTPVVQQRVRQ
ncbi:hypothetical protein M9458_052514, partial [Cirrhinus mrigala]